MIQVQSLRQGRDHLRLRINTEAIICRPLFRLLVATARAQVLSCVVVLLITARRREIIGLSARLLRAKSMVLGELGPRSTI